MASNCVPKHNLETTQDFQLQSAQTNWLQIKLTNRATDECEGAFNPWACCTAGNAGATCCTDLQGASMQITGTLFTKP